MSEHETDTPDTEGGQDAPQVPIIAPPEADTPPPEPVGRTPEAEQGLPPSDGEDNGVGTAPTQDGDSEDGTSGTAFQTTEQIEGTDGEGDDDGGAE